MSGSRSLRSRRENRITDNRSSDANPVSVRATCWTVGLTMLSLTHYLG
ncbi:hypothetical protein GCM10028771_20720 [Nocardioides marmoraquaticus]